MASDLDAVLVAPLPSQNKVLDAFGQLGFSFRSTDVEAASFTVSDRSRFVDAAAMQVMPRL